MKRAQLLQSITALAFIMLCFAFNARSQNTTNSGTEFYTAYMDHNNGYSANGKGTDGGSLMSLYITSTVNTTGIVTIADASFAPINFTVTANQVTIVTIPPAAFLASTGTFNKGVHIVTVKPVAIYAHIYASSVSGATLLLPVSTLGKDYFSINYKQQSNAPLNNPAYSAFIVIATQDNTTVQITPSATLTDGHAANVTFSLNLQKGQLYQGLSGVDLTGTKISSVNSTTGGCTKIAVFSGSSRIDISCNPRNITSDNLFQQVYPTASWGSTYITVPLASRNYDVYRIVLSNPATTVNPNVKINGVPVPLSSFINGYYEFSSQAPNTIVSDQPIQVVQYAVTQNNTITCGTIANDVGDPEMIYLNPVEQTLDHVTLYSTGNYQILKSFINVVLKTTAVPTFVLDGAPYTNFTPIPGNPGYSYAQIPVQSGPQNVQVSSGSQGTHNISAAEGFNAIAYGFGIDESYGYAAGTNLLNLNENITLANPVIDTITNTNGCVGKIYNLQLALPYQTTNIVWDLKNGATYTDGNPKPVSTTIKGTQTTYLYQYPKPITYTTPGDTSVIATVFNPTSGACGNNDVVEFDFNIAPLLHPNFAASTACLGDSTVFKDKTNLNGTTVLARLWDFGDGTTSVAQNPVHLYAKPGSYKVTLSVANQNNCSTDTVQTVYVNHKPVAAFTTSAPDCVGQNITFTDKSTSVDGTVTQWIWSYGDGKTDTLTSAAPFKHSYVNTGIDTVKLTVISSFGCRSPVSTQVIIVSPLPVVDFTVPDVCLNDTFAQFTDRSSIADNTQSGFTYLWNFGDANANAANPNTSTQQNPKHKYTQANSYTISLTVTSANGCTVTKTIPFTVNGDTPVAAFAVENSASLCSSDNIIFDDLSTVNFGNITKVVWYFDYVNLPTDTVVFTKNSIPANRKYYFNYGLFNSPATKSYTVRLDVYSGVSCVSTARQNITVKANPVVAISQIGPLCQSDAPVQIIENKNGFTGTGVFTGAGVSSTGLFTPATAGAGTFTINYTFTAQNGCDYSTSEQVTVNPVPTVSVPAGLTILEGGQLTIPAKATGSNLTYQWIPATGLNNPAILNPVTSATDNITYTLVATNPQGCTAAARVTVNVLKAPVVPNAFSPNGDGINDTWNIKYLDSYPNATVQIFNRYGEIVFSSIGYPIPWDGTYKGVSLPTAAYYYIINPKNGRSVISGNVTIIR